MFRSKLYQLALLRRFTSNTKILLGSSSSSSSSSTQKKPSSFLLFNDSTNRSHLSTAIGGSSSSSTPSHVSNSSQNVSNITTNDIDGSSSSILSSSQNNSGEWIDLAEIQFQYSSDLVCWYPVSSHSNHHHHHHHQQQQQESTPDESVLFDTTTSTYTQTVSPPPDWEEKRMMMIMNTIGLNEEDCTLENRDSSQWWSPQGIIYAYDDDDDSICSPIERLSSPQSSSSSSSSSVSATKTDDPNTDDNGDGDDDGDGDAAGGECWRASRDILYIDTILPQFDWSPKNIFNLRAPYYMQLSPLSSSSSFSSSVSNNHDDHQKIEIPPPPLPSLSGDSFRYTLDPTTIPILRSNQLSLSIEQRKFYEENGYIVIKNLVNINDLKRYGKRFRDYANTVLPIPNGMVVQKEITKKGEKLSEHTLYKLQELYTDAVLFDYCRDANILDYVQCFTGPNILSIHSMFINKPPIDSSSSRHPLHQEIHYFPIRPIDRIVCTWMPLEPTNRANGCLVVVPKSHKFDHLEHDYPDWEGGVNKFYYGIKDASLAEQRVHVEMEPGDCLFFHPLTIHGSGVNRSKGFRKAFSCHFASADCDFIQVNGTIQEKLANEILSIYVDKLSTDTVDEQLKKKKIDYPTMWRLRSRLVRGEGPEGFKRA